MSELAEWFPRVGGGFIMDVRPSGVLGLVDLVVFSPGWSEKVVHLLTEVDGGIALRPWNGMMGSRTGPWLPVVSPSGRKIVAVLPSPAQEAAPLSASGQLVIMDVATENVVETGFAQDYVERRSGEDTEDRTLNYALAHDDLTLAVAATRRTQAHSELSVTVVLPDQRGTVSRVFPGAGMRFTGGFDHHLQWSPDGRHLAVQLREPHERWGVSRYDSLLVLDARTLQTVHRLPFTFLMGSQSWSPEGDLLAVEEVDEGPRLLHLPNERLEALPWMPPRRDDPPRGPEILAMLSEHRALIMPLSRKRARFVIADLVTGKGPTVGSFSLNDHSWPVRPLVSRGWQHLVATSL